MTTLHTKNKIVIAGAGLVGSLLAILLKKRGYDVTIYEKRADIRQHSTEGRSINLVITSRGLYGLEMAGLLDVATQLSVPIYGRMIHNKSGELNYQPYGQANEYNLSVSRTALNRLLLDEAEKCGVKIFFNCEYIKADFTKKIATFQTHKSDPINVSYDVLFGADGSGSGLRRNLLQTFPKEYSENVEWLNADYKELFIPAAPNGDYQLKQNALHIWPRGSHMMMALANLDGSFTVTLYLPQNQEAQNKSPWNFSELKNETQVRDLFKNEFVDAIPLMPNFISDFLNNPQGKLGTVRSTKWIYKDSVALIGDAAHAILPFFGQGMNCGFEDCTVLMDLLDKTSEPTQATWSNILKQYDEERRPNANAIADMAIENWAEMRDKVGDQKFLLRKKVESLLESEFPTLFKSRYGLVAYTRVPYAEAQQVGIKHNKVLDQLCLNLATLDEISLADAKRLLENLD